MNKKYLSEMMQDKVLDTNTLIISPTGSGKTHYIINNLCKDKKVLYLCDNNNLQEQILFEDNTRIVKTNMIQTNFRKTDIQVMTYKSFGLKVKFDIGDEYINSFDLIVCDEIHNLVDYQTFNNDVDLSHALVSVLKRYENTPILMFTATPYYLDELAKKYSTIDRNFTTIDFSDSLEIVRYTELIRDTFSSYRQIPTIMSKFKDGFKYLNKKVLIYTTCIDTMLAISNNLNNDIFNPICIWSASNDSKPMNNEQLKVRDHLLKTGELLEPYNVLIINRATETGVNITDKDMLYCIINTTNATEQIQARGRLRHDIIELRLKADNKIVQNDIYQIDSFLNRPLTREDKLSLCEYLNLFDNKGRLVGWTRIKRLLIERGYVIKDSQKTLNNKRVKVSTISM